MKRSWKIVIIVISTLVCATILNIGVVPAWPPTLVGFMPTTSMEPDIEAGDVFTVDRTVPFHEAKVGDVAVYWRDQSRISHSIVDRTTNELFTQGNNPSWSPMELVTKNQYIGTVKDVYKIPLFNVLYDYIPLGMLAIFPINMIIVAICAGVIGVCVWKRWRKRNALV